MSQEHPKLALIRQHVAQRRYAEARAVLNTIDHPSAVQLLKQIDAQAAVVKRKRVRRLWFLFFALVVITCAFGISWLSLEQQAQSRWVAVTAAKSTEASLTIEAQRATESAPVQATINAIYAAATQRAVVTLTSPAAND